MYMWTMFLPLYARYRLTKWRYQEVRGYSWPEVRGEREREREKGGRGPWVWVERRADGRGDAGPRQRLARRGAGRG